MIDSFCVFCSIIKGHLPLAEVYQDHTFLVLMDKYPINTGHALVVPKQHYANLLLMPAIEVGKLYSLVSIIAESVVASVNADGFNVGQNNGRAANQIIPHVHVHIIPRFSDDSADGKWPTRRVASYEQLRQTAQKIKCLINTPAMRDKITNLALLYPDKR